ncbi:MAG: GDSL-type esterase/lipase family protein [bacterium]
MKKRKITGKKKRRAGIPLFRRALYSAAAVFIFFALAESVLRLAKFHYSTTPLSMQYVNWIKDLGNRCDVPGRGRVMCAFHKDPLLFWFPDANTYLTNSQGFRGPDIKKEKEPGVTRIACVGDSVTQNGFPSFPRMLESLLNAAVEGKKFEVINAGIGSYSSHQGLALFQTKILEFNPDIITVFFGWNDHWLAWSHTDRELAGFWKLTGLRNFFSKSRIYQVLTKVLIGTKKKEGAAARFRVSPEEYGDNLTKICALAKKSNIGVVLITAPTSLTPSSKNTQYLVNRSQLFHRADLINVVHGAYNALVREVALKERVHLFDLEKIMERQKNRDEFFTDGIHFTQKGVELTSRALAEKFKTEILKFKN